MLLAIAAKHRKYRSSVVRTALNWSAAWPVPDSLVLELLSAAVSS